MIQPDIVEYDENHMTKPGFDLILGCNSMNELGIVLDFRTKEITLDEISLPMRDIKNLRTRAAADRAWTAKLVQRATEHARGHETPHRNLRCQI